MPVRAGLSSGPVRAGRGLDLLGRWGRWLLGLAATGTVLTAAAIPLLGEYYGPPPPNSIDPGFNVLFAISSGLARTVAVATIAVVATLTVGAVLGLEPALGRRVLTLLGRPEPGSPRSSRHAAAVRLLGSTGAVPTHSGAPAGRAPVLVLATGVLVIRFTERPPPSEATAVTLS